MANSPSSKKRAAQAARRAQINKARRSRMRTFVRRVEEAIAAGERDAAAEALRLAPLAGAGRFRLSAATRDADRIATFHSPFGCARGCSAFGPVVPPMALRYCDMHGSIPDRLGFLVNTFSNWRRVSAGCTISGVQM